MSSRFTEALHPFNAGRDEVARLEGIGEGDVQLLRIDDPDLFAAILALAQMLDARRDEAVEDAIQRMLDALGPLHLKTVDVALLLENAELRRRYLEAVETLSSEEIHTLSGRRSRNTAETASRWARDGKIFTVKLGREVRAPAFQFADGRPRPEIARILSALPDYQRAGWPAALWFASGHGDLGCAPQEALRDPSRIEEVVVAAERAGGPVG